MKDGMNKLQANLCLICVTLCWSTEVIIFACIPAEVEPFATTCITSGIGALILILAFFKRIRAELSAQKTVFLTRCLILGALNCLYNTIFIYGLKYFNLTTGAFTFSITVVVIPVIMLTLRQLVRKQT